MNGEMVGLGGVRRWRKEREEVDESQRATPWLVSKRNHGGWMRGHPCSAATNAIAHSYARMHGREESVLARICVASSSSSSSS